MTIAQITDLHVVAKGRLFYNRIPTNAQLAQAVAHINSLDPRPDIVFASGDLTEHGHAEEYDLLREILADLIPPVFVIPGNHDRRDVLLKVFGGESYMPPPDAPFVNYAVDTFPLRLIGLDTTVPEHHLSYIPAGYEEVAMLSSLTGEARAQLLAQNRRDYQELCKTEYDR